MYYTTVPNISLITLINIIKIKLKVLYIILISYIISTFIVTT
jgi:hypothetical protein